MSKQACSDRALTSIYTAPLFYFPALLVFVINSLLALQCTVLFLCTAVEWHVGRSHAFFFLAWLHVLESYQ